MAQSKICHCGHHEDDHGLNIYARDGFVMRQTSECRCCWACYGFDSRGVEDDEPDSEFGDPEQSGVTCDAKENPADQSAGGVPPARRAGRTL